MPSNDTRNAATLACLAAFLILCRSCAPEIALADPTVTLILPAGFSGSIFSGTNYSPDALITNAVQTTVTLPATNDVELFTAVSDQVWLQWTPPDSTNVDGYVIYYGDIASTFTNHLYVGNVTNCFVNGISNGADFWFAATALYPQGESGYSNVVTWTNLPFALQIRCP